MTSSGSHNVKLVRNAKLAELDQHCTSNPVMYRNARFMFMFKSRSVIP